MLRARALALDAEPTERQLVRALSPGCGLTCGWNEIRMSSVGSATLGALGDVAAEARALVLEHAQLLLDARDALTHRLLLRLRAFARGLVLEVSSRDRSSIKIAGAREPSALAAPAFF